MGRLFGEKVKGQQYQRRKGVYAVIFNSTIDKVLTVQNSKGDYFLPGGGIVQDETNWECLEREMLEETGFAVLTGSFIGNGKRHFQSTKNEWILSDAYFYLVQLVGQVQEPIDVDHTVRWVNLENVRDLFLMNIMFGQ